MLKNQLNSAVDHLVNTPITHITLGFEVMILQPSTTDIHHAIERITAHKVFFRSPLMCAFLRYVALETLAGRESRISAYSVAVDALKKSPTFDPQTDPSVRVLAKRLRDSLETYYANENDYDVMVVMRPGSYIPKFEKVTYYACPF